MALFRPSKIWRHNFDGYKHELKWERQAEQSNPLPSTACDDQYHSLSSPRSYNPSNLIFPLCSQAPPGLPRALSARGISESIIFKLRDHLQAPSDGAVDTLSLYYSRPDCRKNQANIAADTLSRHPPGEPNQRSLGSQSSEPHSSESHDFELQVSEPRSHVFKFCAFEHYVSEPRSHAFKPYVSKPCSPILSLTFPSLTLTLLSLALSSFTFPSLVFTFTSLTLRVLLFWASSCRLPTLLRPRSHCTRSLFAEHSPCPSHVNAMRFEES